jgi:hypothetical protein
MDANSVINRLKTLLGLKTDAELALVLGMTKSGVSVWRKRNTYGIIRIHEKFPGLNLNWLLSGVGEPGVPPPTPSREEIAYIEHLSHDVYIPLGSTPLAFQIAYWEGKLSAAEVGQKSDKKLARHSAI